MVDVFLIDPPWPKKKGGIKKVRPNQGRELDYSTMSVSDIFDLLDRDIFPANEKHTVFLWCIDQFLHEAEKAMLDRGYRLHARMVWDKITGPPPAYTVRYCHEYLLWFYKPNLTPVDKEQRGKFSTVFREKSREHSRKPECVYDFIDAIYPFERKMDVFSRQKREGWSQYGDQTDYFPRSRR